MAPELQRSTGEEKTSQLERLSNFKKKHQEHSSAMVDKLKETAASGDNVFEVLMGAVRVCSLGHITEALFDAGGQYRRNM